ncbi:MAG: phosphate signaling complex protein PhoU [Candidatus Omnitrophica bacterium]|nr:phosphate signaling complex protein PhoU [Candidatus Omnitrophota bacterium]
MERHFDTDLNELKKELLKLAALTETAIYKSIEALEKQDTKLANEIIDEDAKIDELELIIEEKSLELLALRQPMASDLRFITTGMKINAELERIADLAENIAERVIELADKPLLKPLIDIPRLGEIARIMLKNSIDSFVNKNEELAKSVIFQDEEADSIRNLIYDELMYDYIVKDGTLAPRAIPLLLVARHLERICDHASYIASDVIYMINSTIVRHHPERLDADNKD